MLKKLFKNEVFNIFVGLILGIGLTYWGANIQENKHQKYDKEKIDKETTVLLYNQLNSRFLWAQNVLTSSKSDVLFEDRWDIYIKDGYMPWQVNKFRFLKHFGNRQDLSAKIEKVDSELGELHDLLIKLRQKVIYDKPIKEKEDARHLAGEKNKKVKELIAEINEELMK